MHILIDGGPKFMKLVFMNKEKLWFFWKLVAEDAE